MSKLRTYTMAAMVLAAVAVPGIVATSAQAATVANERPSQSCGYENADQVVYKRGDINAWTCRLTYGGYQWVPISPLVIQGRG